ncbi:LysM peptidoglycan-binding domain-containing M23 family metallopeptidase [Altericista sp. CCNU0014]|uniref:LysM peptidoglycan-binding domain-containing M23 family metallopeptidase n=1 Tax=Altericista sp. CCNU0014 TaxID=3082949 RepID=UPI00384DD0FD
MSITRRYRELIAGSCLAVLALDVLQSSAVVAAPPVDCPTRPALERLRQHKVRPRETLTQIAARYGLVSATLMGMNPAVRNGQVAPGQVLTIPPYNGIVVSLAPGQTIQSAAKSYGVKPDVLFEVNGCQNAPKTVFVPGANWSPVTGKPMAAGQIAVPPKAELDPFLRRDRYPLPLPAALKRAYGWQPTGPNKAVVFASGVDLAAAADTPVYAVADGTVAFVGVQKPWGNLIVVNHARGRQTRYGYLGTLNVKVGQAVRRGQVIAAVGNTPASALRFELRYRSQIGWVAQDPQPYLQAISGTKKPQF